MGCAMLLVSLTCHGQSSPTPGVPEKVLPEKVIIDTDIGDDVDDAFALALALRSPELQILGITTTFGDTETRAKLVDRFLAEAGHGEIPVRLRSAATPKAATMRGHLIPTLSASSWNRFAAIRARSP